MSSIQLEIPIEALRRPGVAQALAQLTLTLGSSAERLTPGRATRPAPTAYAAPAVVAEAVVESAEPAKAAEPAKSGEPTVTAPVVAAPPVERAQPVAQADPPAQAKATDAGASSAQRTSRTPAPTARRTTSPAGLAALPPDVRWKRYVSELPENSQRFLSLLETKGRLGVSEAVEALNLATPKAMGGLTGAMARWAPAQGIQLPYEAKVDKDGNRYWIWIGVTPP